MSWFKTAKHGVSDKELNKILKRFIRTSMFVRKIFNEYNIDIDAIDGLVFKTKDLDGRYAQSDSKSIYLDNSLFEDNSFFDKHVHFVIHELTHWLTRQKEKDFYFADPEEIAAFESAIAYEITRGQDHDTIIETFYPIIEAHVSNSNSKELFDAIYAKAKIRANGH